MGRFNDLISTLGTGEDGATVAYPDTFLDDINSAYGEDMGLADSAVQVLTDEVAKLTQQNIELQAEMYSLIKQIPATDGEPSIEEDNSSDDTDDNDDDVEDIFGEPEYK